MTEHATAAAGKTPAPARPGPAPLGSKQAHREATERDKRARRFLLRLSLINWGIAVVAWTISAFLGITSPASILIYSVLFVIGLFAVIMALLTYLLEKFAHRPPDYEHANLEGDGDEGGPAVTGAAAATGSVAAATAVTAAAPAAKEAAPAAAKDAARAAPAQPPKEAAPAAAAAKTDAPAAKEATPAAAPKDAAPAAPAQAPKDAAPSADAGSKAPPAKGDAPAAPAKDDASAAPGGGDGKAAKGDAPAPPAG